MPKSQHIRLIPNDEALTVFSLMKQLRPHLVEENFLKIYKMANQADQYSLYGYYSENQCVAVMGLRYLSDFVHGYHLYIDDLVVEATQRSKGIGADLLKYAEELAVENKCTGLRLCTGVENKAGIKFYERENWNFRAVVYKKKV